MPSNKDLKTEALLLAKDLGVDLDFKGLKNPDLANLVSDLKAKLKDRANVTQADGAPPKPFEGGAPPKPPEDDAPPKPPEDDAPPKPPEDDAPPKPPEPVVVKSLYSHTVAPGKAVTCAKGMLDQGAEIKADWLGGGEKSLRNLVEQGYVIED